MKRYPVKLRTLAAVLLCVALGGCAKGGVTRDQAAGAVIAVSGAVRLADRACALAAIEAKSYELADKCADVYDTARESLLAAALGLDVWDTDKARSACAIVDAVKQVRMMSAGGRELSAVLAAGESLASPFCRR